MPSLDNIEQNISEEYLEREKAELVKIYQELDDIKLEDIDSKIESLKNLLERRIKRIDELIVKENNEFAQMREEEIKNKQRLGQDRYLNHPYEIVKKKDEPKIPLFEILAVTGLSLVIILLLILIFTL